MACSTSASEFTLEDLRVCARTCKADVEILDHFVAQSSRIEATIDLTEISRELGCEFIGLLSKALSCQTKTSSVVQLMNIIRDSRLLRDHVPKLLMNIQRYSTKKDLLQFITHTFSILEEILSRMPSSFAQNLGLIMIIKTVAEVESNSDETDIKTEFDEIVKNTVFLRNSAFLELHKSKESKVSEKHLSQLKPPPNNFREIPVLPCKSDIFPTSDIYLRPIIVKGSYQNLEHYLDVQFRLYREDCISPLRDGITEYVTQLTGGKEVRRLQDVRLYKNVRIVNKEITLEGLVYWVELDPRHSRRIRWESSKRLLYGSLVCLSHDDFGSLLFAIVVDSDRAKLHGNGTLKVQFANIDLLPYKISDTKFTMVETMAYFEAYRHVLPSLQKIRKGELPFERYIVHCENDTLPPIYLKIDENYLYDLLPIETNEYISITPEVENVRGYRSSKRVDILSDEWPSADELHLDTSQYDAFRSALTKEFVLIQGPPGTGKTHVGLQIAKALLHNRQNWMQENVEGQPMLVVCFTNHALDQFMEGIVGFLEKSSMSWEDEIVRVGGRCSNETIEKLSLKYKRSRNADSRIHYTRLNRLQENIAFLKWQLKMSEEIIFDDILKETVVEQDFLFLFESDRPGENEEKKPPLLYSWLGVTRNCWLSRTHKIYEQLPLEEKFYIDTLNTTDLCGAEEPKPSEDEARENVEVKAEADVVRDERQIEDEKLLLKTEFNEDLGLNVNTLLNEILRTEYIPRTKAFTDILSQQADEALVQLKKPDVMTEKMIRQLQTSQRRRFWRLSYEDRWKLYRHWLHRYRTNTNVVLSEKMQEFEKTVDDYKRERAKEDEDILKRSTVIAITTTGAARYQDTLRKVGPKIILVEEAAEVLEAHIVSTLSPKCEHLILIGDHKQLEPKPAVYELAKKYNLSLSMFERIVKNGLSFHCLENQHRMRPDISKIVRHVYSVLRDNENVLEYEDILGVKKNVFFINHTHEENYDDDGRTYTNAYEAEFVVQLCRYLIKQGYDKTQITVLAAYSGQMFRIRKHMPKEEFHGLRLSVVDNYQGEENDIVILSLVRNNDKNVVGFLKRENRICVALSRAKKGLYIIGNVGMLTKASGLWEKVFADLKEMESVGEELPLYCQNHPKAKGIMAKDPLDFDKAPDGGCSMDCDFRLPCGHACIYKCHPIDREHKEYDCGKQCRKECENDHRCVKICHYPKDCFCPVEMNKDLPCGHEARMKCCDDPKTYMCEILVKKVLNCSHAAEMLCHEDKERRLCKVEVTVTLPKCNHTAFIPCFKNRNLEVYRCKEKVTVLLTTCNHEAELDCYLNDIMRRLYRCKKVIEKKFPCGHEKKIKCSEAKYAHCDHPCENKCENGHICGRQCHYEYNDKCNCSVEMEKCIPTCDHIQKMKCCEQPSTVKCITIVSKTIPECGHLQKMECYLEPELHNCTEIVEKRSLCGHFVNVKCSTSECRIEDYCEEIVSKKLPKCDHTIKLPCNAEIDEQKCFEKVEMEHEICGHNFSLPCHTRAKLQLWGWKGCRILTELKKYEECTTMVQIECAKGHVWEVLCSKQRRLKCQERCGVILPCGHECTGVCSECESRRHHIDCKTEVTRRCRLGHVTKQQCTETLKCMFPCGQILFCGHKCSKVCCDCNEGTFHIPCNYVCQKNLICGHKCSSPCGGCRICMIPCDYYCDHFRCEHACSEPCKPCLKPCTWSCQHVCCTRLCHEVCDRGPCNKPCQKRLRCNHKCAGYCSEPCPRVCRVCNSREFKKVKESSTTGKVFVVVLPDCGHEFNSKVLDKYMGKVGDTPASIEAAHKVCPKCKSRIKWHPRYGNILKVQRSAINFAKTEFTSDTDVKSFTKDINESVSYLREFQYFCDIFYNHTDVLSLELFLSKISPESKNIFSNLQFLQRRRVATTQQVRDINNYLLTVAIQWLVYLRIQKYENIDNDFWFDQYDDADSSVNICSRFDLEKITLSMNGLIEIVDRQLQVKKTYLTSEDFNMVKDSALMDAIRDDLDFVTACKVPYVREQNKDVHQCDWITCGKGHCWPAKTTTKKCQWCDEQKLKQSDVVVKRYTNIEAKEDKARRKRQIILSSLEDKSDKVYETHAAAFQDKRESGAAKSAPVQLPGNWHNAPEDVTGLSFVYENKPFSGAANSKPEHLRNLNGDDTGLSFYYEIEQLSDTATSAPENWRNINEDDTGLSFVYEIESLSDTATSTPENWRNLNGDTTGLSFYYEVEPLSVTASTPNTWRNFNRDVTGLSSQENKPLSGTAKSTPENWRDLNRDATSLSYQENKPLSGTATTTPENWRNFNRDVTGSSYQENKPLSSTAKSTPGNWRRNLNEDFAEVSFGYDDKPFRGRGMSSRGGQGQHSERDHSSGQGPPAYGLGSRDHRQLIFEEERAYNVGDEMRGRGRGRGSKRGQRGASGSQRLKGESLPKEREVTDVHGKSADTADRNIKRGRGRGRGYGKRRGRGYDRY